MESHPDTDLGPLLVNIWNRRRMFNCLHYMYLVIYYLCPTTYSLTFLTYYSPPCTFASYHYQLFSDHIKHILARAMQNVQKRESTTYNYIQKRKRQNIVQFVNQKVIIN